MTKADAIDASLYNQEQRGLVGRKKRLAYNKAIAYIKNPEQHPAWRKQALAAIQDALQFEGDRHDLQRNTFDPSLSETGSLIHRLGDLWARLQKR